MIRGNLWLWQIGETKCSISFYAGCFFLVSKLFLFLEHISGELSESKQITMFVFNAQKLQNYNIRIIIIRCNKAKC